MDLLYLNCPGCGSKIKHPLNPQGAPHVVIHSCSRRRNARLIVLPKEGEVHEVPNAVSLETALRFYIARAS